MIVHCYITMADVHNKETRSYNMSRIKGKNTKPEMLVRRFLHANGFRYRLHVKDLPGKPDIALPKYKTVIFIQGCFWHGHDQCRYYVIPKTKTEWWLNKINGNKTKDSSNIESLKNAGWQVIEIWECELKPKQKSTTLTNLLAYLTQPVIVNII
ncbi:very short patch repair endonuclease [Pedobacter riviphilus]|nr:very short patch repair endonuclease [Pedobacter riviphilus]